MGEILSKISRVFLVCALICYTPEAKGVSWLWFCGFVSKAMEVPPALPPTPREKEYSNALEYGGIVVTGKKQIPESLLADGRYVYLVATHKGKEYVAWGRAAPGEITPEKNLITHTSLFNELTRQLRAEPEIVGAGQSLILNGKVGVIDNKSGTRRGTNEHLDYSARKLTEHGLAITPETQRKDFSDKSVKGAHAKAALLAKLKVEVDRDPSLTEQRQTMIAMHSALFREHPFFQSPEKPGHLNLEHIFDFERVESLLERKLSEGEKEELRLVKDFMDMLETESPDFLVIRLKERGLLSKDFGPGLDLLHGRAPREIPWDREIRGREAQIQSNVNDVLELLNKAEALVPERLFDLNRIAERNGKPLTPVELRQIEYARRLISGYRNLGDPGLRLLVSHRDFSYPNFFHGMNLAAGQSLYVPEE